MKNKRLPRLRPILHVLPLTRPPSRARRISAFVLLALAGVLLSAGAAEPWRAPASAADTRNPVRASNDSIAQGRKIYSDRCADCHGNKGRGDGSGGLDLERRPTDLTSAKVLAQTDGELFWKITEGRRPMPGYGRKLPEEQRWQVVSFLRSLASKGGQKAVDRKASAQNQNQP